MADQDDITNATSAQLPEGFKVVGGRKFANNIKYLLPNDDDERDRLTQQHYVVRQLIHGNFNAPVEDFLEQGIRVLDAGCGNGLWLLDMAQDYPRSIFVGTDASAEGFPTSDVPPNCTFILADTLQGLPFQDSTFDYVFQRFMNGAFSPADWASAVKEFTRVAKSGAYLELFELSLQYKRTPPGPPRLRDANERITHPHSLACSHNVRQIARHRP
ncbi:S-adenosyl-L-methionine-dependent methyltransferase [Jimgerdemannia flammicorona]|uniref:S-adenosyl-L-methionine-dependent methyltransferase n=1 Tax=Jimgerdemannia flammicorona TaxID=994334 RepID=A0A433QTI3_9FUNG|nr:S-adenosyl-L-methionine-dependent methyltransferase [Jimgerdemannia flammicorona]